MEESLQAFEIEPVTVKGKATIEIFEGGALVNRISKTNYVNTTLRKAVARYVADGKAITADFSLFNTSNEKYYQAPNCITLRNNDLSASPNGNEIPLGETVGYGRMGVTAPGSKQGTYVALESVLDNPLYRKMVFDFPNSSANGVFNNIYTFGGYNNDTNTDIQSYGNYSLERIDNDYGSMYAMDDIYVYVLLKSGTGGTTTTSKIGRFTKDNFAKALYTGIAKDLYEVITLPADVFVRTIAYLDGYFYFTGTEGKLYRSTKNNPAAVTLVKTFATPELYDVRYLSVGADPVSKKLYILVAWTTAPQAGSLYVIDKTNFSVLDRMYFRDFSDNCYLLRFDPRGRYLAVGEYIFDTQTKKMTDTAAGKFINTDGPFGLPIFDQYSNLVTQLAGSYSRFMLDSPVTKTNTQTMKITYEFTLEQAPVTAAPIT